MIRFRWGGRRGPAVLLIVATAGTGSAIAATRLVSPSTQHRHAARRAEPPSRTARPRPTREPVIDHVGRGGTIQLAPTVRRRDRLKGVRALSVAGDPATQLAAIIARLGPESRFESAKLGPPPTGMNPKGVWLFATMKGTTGTPIDGVIAVWQSDMVAAVLRDSMHRDGAVLGGSETTLHEQDGSRLLLIGHPIGNIAYEQVFATGDAATLTGAVEARARAAGIELARTTAVQPAQVAPMAYITAADPAAFLQQHPTYIRDVFGDVNAYEGGYVEIDDTAGRPWAAYGFSSRAAGGHAWVDPSVPGAGLGDKSMPPSP